jgi:hypothetical protein
MGLWGTATATTATTTTTIERQCSWRRAHACVSQARAS